MPERKDSFLQWVNWLLGAFGWRGALIRISYGINEELHLSSPRSTIVYVYVSVDICMEILSFIGTSYLWLCVGVHVLLTTCSNLSKKWP